jgi:hypothetical protein
MFGRGEMAARALSWVRWFVHEFFAIALGLDASSIVTSLGRVAGVIVMYGIARASLMQGLAPGALAAVTQCAFVGTLAIVVGNIAKELAIDLGARVLGWCRREYRRDGVKPDGKTYSQTLYPDGTWFRSESGPAGTVCEWTDPSGACNRIVTGARKRAPR